MSKFLKDGNTLRVADIEATFDKLPVGVYNLGLDNRGYYLTKSVNFTLPEKIYGDLSVVDRWLKTYNDKKRNVGVLLSGLKGGGKTITAKLLAIKANKPIITVSMPFSGQDFIDFITDPILGECVIFLDEFEKVYSSGKNSDGNDALLSLLDGPYETHHLFVFTVNETNINSNLINRPSRILYTKKYDGLSEDDVIEIANDKLKNKDFMDDLIRTSHKIFQLSFDILISIIDEINRFNEPASKCIEYMNLTPKQVSLTAKEWYLEDGKIENDYCGYGINPEYRDEDGLRCSVRYYFNLILSNGEIKDDYEVINLPMEMAKKVTHNTYEIFDEDLCVLYTFTEETNNYSSYTHNVVYRPKNVNYEKLTIYLDENNKYVRHTPEEISLETIKSFVNQIYFNDPSKSKTNSIKIEDYPEELCYEPACAG